MNYETLISLRIFHEYYQSEICPDFFVEPTPACLRFLQGHRLIMKTMDHGICIIAPMASPQQRLIPLPETTTFTFQLTLANSAFASFTEFDRHYSPSNSFYHFSNQSNPNGSELTPVLVPRSKKNDPKNTKITPLAPPLAPSAFGLVTILYNPSKSLPPDGYKDFHIRFSSKKQVWKYYLIAANSDQAASFSIQAEKANISFSNTEIPVDDRVLGFIHHHFPNSYPVLFLSDHPIPCQEMGKPDLQLIKAKAGKPKAWIEHLPNPPNHHGTQIINVLQEV